MKATWRLLRLMTPLLLAVWPPSALGAQSASENAAHAAFLFNFLQFSDLPAGGAGQVPLDICVATGDPDRLAAMEQLQERQIRSRPLVVRSYRQDGHCDAIYVDSRGRWQALAERHGNALAVGVYPGFINDGGMVEINFLESRPRFDINLAQAKRAGIRFNPQLLRLARRIIE